MCLSAPQVTPGSKAAQADLCIGDMILAIDGEPTEHMTHLQAQNKIKGCGDEMALSVDRYVVGCWDTLPESEVFFLHSLRSKDTI